VFVLRSHFLTGMGRNGSGVRGALIERMKTVVLRTIILCASMLSSVVKCRL
jgi:hypothetical protein